MKIEINGLSKLKEACEVVPGNIYPARGGKRPGTEFWLVASVTGNSAHLLGFGEDGTVVSTASYLKSAMRERPIIGRCDLSTFKLEVEAK